MADAPSAPQPRAPASQRRAPASQRRRRPCGTSARFGMIVILGMICPREGEVTLCRTHQCKRNFGGKARPRRGGGLERDTDVRFETVALDDVLAATAVVRSKASSSARADHLFITADPNHRGRRAVRPRQSKTLTRRVMLGHDLDGRRSPVERLRHTPEAGSVHQLRGAGSTPRPPPGPPKVHEVRVMLGEGSAHLAASPLLPTGLRSCMIPHRAWFALAGPRS